MYEGQGEFFDLSVKPIYRDTFCFGEGNASSTKAYGFYVAEGCNKCGKCIKECPQSCIGISAGKVTINQNHCLHCGRCCDICPLRAIVKKG